MVPVLQKPSTDHMSSISGSVHRSGGAHCILVVIGIHCSLPVFSGYVAPI